MTAKSFFSCFFFPKLRKLYKFTCGLHCKMVEGKRFGRRWSIRKKLLASLKSHQNVKVNVFSAFLRIINKLKLLDF